MAERRTAAVPMTEAAFTALVIELAHLAHWRVAHFRPCRTEKGWRTAVQGDVGFPDIVAVHPEHGIIFAELKTDAGRLTAEQWRWMECFTGLGRAELDEMRYPVYGDGVEFHVWRPRNLETIKRVLGVKEAAREYADKQPWARLAVGAGSIIADDFKAGAAWREQQTVVTIVALLNERIAATPTSEAAEALMWVVNAIERGDWKAARQ
jgi:hypothetical protein